VLRITTRNARFQEWQALLANRKKRQRAGEFIVQGVRPVTLAARHGWLICDADRSLSAWRAACDRITRIPITGSASSFNAASAATVLLYEAARQRPRQGSRETDPQGVTG
jgi:tRNA G18 (ribose-2'-O)-methylase SpoU